MKQQTAAESKAREGIRRLRTEVDLEKYPEIAGVADSLEKLVDGASRGGKSRAKKLTKKRRKEIASNAAKARWAKPGPKRKGAKRDSRLEPSQEQNTNKEPLMARDERIKQFERRLIEQRFSAAVIAERIKGYSQGYDEGFADGCTAGVSHTARTMEFVNDALFGPSPDTATTQEFELETPQAEFVRERHR